MHILNLLENTLKICRANLVVRTYFKPQLIFSNNSMQACIFPLLPLSRIKVIIVLYLMGFSRVLFFVNLRVLSAWKISNKYSAKTQMYNFKRHFLNIFSKDGEEDQETAQTELGCNKTVQIFFLTQLRTSSVQGIFCV